MYIQVINIRIACACNCAFKYDWCVWSRMNLCTCSRTHNCGCNMWICVIVPYSVSTPIHTCPLPTHVSFPNRWSSSSFQWTHLLALPSGWRWCKLRQWEPAPSGGSERCHSGSPGWRCSGSLRATKEQACVYTLRPRQNGCHLGNDEAKMHFSNENIRFSFQIPLEFVAMRPDGNNPALVNRVTGNKPLSEPVMV